MKSVAANPFGFLFLFGIAHAQINLASNGTASQSSTYVKDGYSYNASLAVTGEPTHNWRTKSCSATDAGKRVSWWMLTFPSESVFVSNIVIYYRSDLPKRLTGYSLFITNNNFTTSPSDGLCYHHDGKEIPYLVQNITCDLMGKHVIIYNERTKDNYNGNYSDVALLELCDVQIIGCYKSWWGDGCKIPCPSYCTDNHCYPDNGTCVLGCNSSNCLHGYCTNDGICTDGCIKGHAGLKCTNRNMAKEVVLVPVGGSPTPLIQITDGEKTESCITLSGSESWIQIDTGELQAVKTINVNFKGADTGFHEYMLSIANSSGIMVDALNLTNQNIVKYTSPLPVNVHNLKSEVIGRYVLLRSNVSALDICEVEIIGCPAGLHGDQCDISCPSNCDGGCHPENGQCVVGCKDGYFLSQCKKCTACREGVSISLFVSVLVSVIVIAVSVNCGTCVLYRRHYGAMLQRQTGNKCDDLHVYSTPEKKAENKETTYDELGGK